MCWSCQARSLCCSAYSFVCPNSFISRLCRREYNPTKKDPNPKFRREDRFWWSTHLSVHACDMIIISLLESKAWQKVGARWIAWQEFGRGFYFKKIIRPGHELQHRNMDQKREWIGKTCTTNSAFSDDQSPHGESCSKASCASFHNNKRKRIWKEDSVAVFWLQSFFNILHCWTYCLQKLLFF